MIISAFTFILIGDIPKFKGVGVRSRDWNAVRVVLRLEIHKRAEIVYLHGAVFAGAQLIHEFSQGVKEGRGKP